MRRAPLKTIAMTMVAILTLVITACNMPTSDGGTQEASSTEDQGTTVTEEQDGDRDQDQDQRPTSETGPTEGPSDGGGGPPTPDLSDVDPLGGLSPISHLGPSTTPLTLTYLWMVDESNGWSIGDTDGTSDHVFHTDSGAGSWEDVTPPAPVEIPDLGHPAAAAGAFLDDDTAWVIYYPDVSIFEAGGLAHAFVWRTTNGGQSWSPSYPITTEMIGSSNIPPDVVFSDSMHGWIMMHWGGQGMHRSPVYLFRTTDGGATWENLEDPYSGMYLQSCTKTGMAFYGANYGMVTIADCPIDGIEVDVTNDGGETWEDIRLPPPSSRPDLFNLGYCNAHSPAFLDDGTAIVGATCKTFGDTEETIYLIYTSTDYGVTWTAEEYPGGNLYFLDEDTAWGLSGDLYTYTPSADIYRTTDGGDNWIKLNTVTWYGQFVFIDEDTGWAIARNEDEIATVGTVNGGASWNIVESFVTE
jgi:photosystem II stability/assembly factor-like uncharacterized protein